MYLNHLQILPYNVLQLALAVLLLTSPRPVSHGRPGSWAPVQVISSPFDPVFHTKKVVHKKKVGYK